MFRVTLTPVCPEVKEPERGWCYLDISITGSSRQHAHLMQQSLMCLADLVWIWLGTITVFSLPYFRTASLHKRLKTVTFKKICSLWNRKWCSQNWRNAEFVISVTESYFVCVYDLLLSDWMSGHSLGRQPRRRSVTRSAWCGRLWAWQMSSTLMLTWLPCMRTPVSSAAEMRYGWSDVTSR